MLTGCLETDGSEGEPLSNGCVWLRSKKGEKRNRNDVEKGRKWWWKRKGRKKGREVSPTPLYCVPDRLTREKMSQRLSNDRKLCRVSGPNAYQFLCS